MEEVLKKSLPRCMNKEFSLIAWGANTREGWSRGSGSLERGEPDRDFSDEGRAGDRRA